MYNPALSQKKSRESHPMMPQSLFKIVFLTLFLLANGALACHCVTPLSAKTAYQQADLVVLGQLPEMEVIEASSQTSANTFQISAAWKTPATPTLVVITGETCAEQFSKGKTYLLYLKNLNDGRYATSRCAGNRERGAANAALTWLKNHGQVKAIAPPPVKPTMQPNSAPDKTKK